MSMFQSEEEKKEHEKKMYEREQELLREAKEEDVRRTQETHYQLGNWKPVLPLEVLSDDEKHAHNLKKAAAYTAIGVGILAAGGLLGALVKDYVDDHHHEEKTEEDGNKEE